MTAGPVGVIAPVKAGAVSVATAFPLRRGPGWGANDWHGKRGSILRSAMQYVDLILHNLAGYLAFQYMPLS